MSEFTRTTIVFPKRGNRVLLGMKKRGFGEGWYNGFGGKLENDESFEDNAKRETLEESGLHISKLTLVAKLLFYFDGAPQIASAAFISNNFTGEPSEKEEMIPEWFNLQSLPYDRMWPADKLWIPEVLSLPADPQPLELTIYFITKDGKPAHDRTEKADEQLILEVFNR